MVDLKPDTSIYDRFSKGQNLNDLLGVAQKARALQSDQALSDALKESGGNVEQTQEKFLKSGATVYPEQLSGLQTLGGDMMKLQQARQDNAYAAVTWLRHIQDQDQRAKLYANVVMPTLKAMKMPSNIINEVGAHIPDDKFLAAMESGLVNRGAMDPQEREVTLPSGQTAKVPRAAIIAGGQPGLPSGGHYTSLPGGANESIAASQAAYKRGSAFQDEVFPYERALEKMQEMQANGETFGPGSHGRNVAEGFVQALSPPLAHVLGINPDKIANYSEVEKYLSQGLLSRSGQWGTHLADQFATSMAATPNVHITDLAGVPLVKAGLAVRTMDHVQDWLAQRYGDANFTREGQRISPLMDPRAFGIKYMGDKEIQDFHKSLTGRDRLKFNANVAAGILSGVIPNYSRASKEDLEKTVNSYFYQSH